MPDVDEDVRAPYEETRRHFDVVAEQMRADLRLLADGLGSLREHLTRVEQNLREEILRSKRELSASSPTPSKTEQFKASNSSRRTSTSGSAV